MQPARPRRRRTARAFTLIEVMIVVVIIGMLMTLVGPNVIKHLKKARQATAKNQILLLSNAIDDYYLDLSEYPGKLDDLVTNPGRDKWDGPYLKPPKVPLDPWQSPYQYTHPGQHGEYDLYSYGSDKSPGGEGEAADVNNWE